MTNGRILLIHPEGNLHYNPNLHSFVLMLNEAGYEVDIYSRYSDTVSQAAPAPGTRFFRVQGVASQAPDHSVLFPLPGASPQTYREFITQHLPKYDLVIGVDLGIIDAATVAEVQGAPLVLLSYEIYFEVEEGAAFKSRERLAAQRADLVLCQDPVRSAALASENGLDLSRFIQFPVAPRGSRTLLPNSPLREKLGIPTHRKVALYMGELNGQWAGTTELFRTFAGLQDEWTLVLHHRYGTANLERLQSLARDAGAPNIVNSPFDSLPLDEMATLLSGVDIGIALYFPNETDPLANRNLQKIGLASGKLACYLQYGVPILINEIGQMSEYVRSYGCGISVANVGEISSRLRELAPAKSLEMRQQARKLFAEVLDLNQIFPPVLKKIRSLISPAARQETVIHTTDGSIEEAQSHPALVVQRPQRRTPHTPQRIWLAPGLVTNESFAYHDLCVATALQSQGVENVYAESYSQLQVAHPILLPPGAGTSQIAGAQRLAAAEAQFVTLLRPFSVIHSMDGDVARQLREIASEELVLLQTEDLIRMEIGGLPVGLYAKRIVQLKYGVDAHVHLYDHIDELRAAVSDAIILTHAFSEVVERYRPTGIFGYQSELYPWAIVRQLAVKHSIPLYHYYADLIPERASVPHVTPSKALDLELIGRIASGTAL